jgi:hypothetical protein
MINVANLSEEYPFWVTQDEYDELSQKKQLGWSNCDSKKEWMVKLHYLRKGFKDGKINREKFFAMERELVTKWWRKWCQ